jgi:glycosyltransferase involved in cell wall biosynthesis
MKFSIVTAVFNRVGTIADTIQSVQAQTYDSVEHVIQDGGSTDGTIGLIERMSCSATSFESDRDEGIYDAINRGILRASGDVVGLMHSDDFYASPLVLEKVAVTLSDPRIDGVYGDLQYVSASDPSRVIRQWQSGLCSRNKIAWGWMPPHPTLYLRREVFERWGLYDTNLRIAADYDAMLRWIVKGGIRLSYIPEVLVKMRVGGESNRSLESILRKSREDYTAIRRNGVGGLPTLVAKNLRKIPQFLTRQDRSGKQT